MSLHPGDNIGRYVVERQLGAGGMAVVFLARHLELGSLHAIKVLHLAAPKLQERALQEGRIQASLQHPNVVRVTDVLRLPGGAPALVMEFVDGPTLESLMLSSPPDLEQVDPIAEGVMRGVAAAHRQGLVHRDLKPDNILLSRGDEGWIAKVTDFGLAKVLSDVVDSKAHATRTGIMMGTPDYMAPEQVRSAKHVDHRADLFALGAVFYRVVTRRQPFQGKDILEILEAVTSGSYTPVRELAPRAPERIIRAIEGALRVDPASRWQSCEEMLACWRGERVEDIVVRVPTLPPVPVHAGGSRPALPTTPIEPMALRLATDASIGTVAPLGEGEAPAASLAMTTPPLAASPEPERAARPRGLVLVAAMALLLLGGLTAWVSMHGGGAGSEARAMAGQPPPLVSDVEPEGAAEVSGPQAPETSPPEVVREEPPSRSGAVEAPQVSAVPAARGEAEPAPTPAPQAAQEPAVGTRLELAGQWRGYLIGDEGQRFELGRDVPAGDYELWVFFDAVKPTRVSRVSLAPEERKTLSCQEALRACR